MACFVPLIRERGPFNKHHQKESAGSEFQNLLMVDDHDGCIYFSPPLELMHNLKNATSNSPKEHIEVLTYGYAYGSANTGLFHVLYNSNFLACTVWCQSIQIDTFSFQ